MFASQEPTAAIYADQTTTTEPTKVKKHSEKELDFKISLYEELVSAWENAKTKETKDAFKRVMCNVGLKNLGEIGWMIQ